MTKFSKLLATLSLTFATFNTFAFAGVEPGIAGQMVYRYTVNDPDPAFRLGSAALVQDRIAGDNAFTFFDSGNGISAPVYGPYLTLTGGGMLSGEFDFELINTEPSLGYCQVGFDLVQAGGKAKHSAGSFHEGANTWRSAGVPFNGTVDGIELRVSRVWSQAYNWDDGFPTCMVHLKELRIIHTQGL